MKRGKRYGVIRDPGSFQRLFTLVFRHREQAQETDPLFQPGDLISQRPQYRWDRGVPGQYVRNTS